MQYLVRLIFLMMTVMGLSLLVMGVKDFRHGKESHVWPKVEAIILFDGHENLWNLTGTHYAYYFEGKNRRAKRVSFIGSNRLFRMEKSKFFKAGQMVDIYVNPHDPEMTVMEAHANIIGLLFFILTGTMISFFSLGCLFQTFRTD